MLLQQFQQHLKTQFSQLSINNFKLLLAVSGGIDSIVMTDLFYKSGFNFSVAHCNFKLREEESERDEAFVQSIASKYNKEIFIRRFDTNEYAEKHKISIQEAARNLRYSWFEEIVKGQSSIVKVNSDVIHDSRFTVHYLVTAHNADDNIETALMFFLRGSGIHGLTGIALNDKERKIIRPLLFTSRKDIELYANENNLTWVEDSSNSTEKYTRNYLRNSLIPAVQQFFPDVKQNVLNNIKRLKEVEQLYDQSIQSYKKNLLELKDNEVHIPILKLQKIKPLDTIIWEIMKEYNFHASQIDEVKKLFDAENSSYIKSSTHTIIKNRNWLIIASNKKEETLHVLIEENDNNIKFEQGILSIEKLKTANYKLQTINNIAQLDSRQITFPLLLRKWKQGDYFYPLGMSKKKKLSRFFIDKKLSSIQKENTWVLESNKKILWIINYRIDDRFKLNQSTKEFLQLTFQVKSKA